MSCSKPLKFEHWVEIYGCPQRWVAQIETTQPECTKVRSL